MGVVKAPVCNYLWQAQLQDAQLTGAQLQDADLRGARLQGAYLEGANLTSVKDLTQDELNMAFIDENTKLPEGLTRPAPCPAKP